MNSPTLQRLASALPLASALLLAACGGGASTASGPMLTDRLAGQGGTQSSTTQTSTVSDTTTVTVSTPLATGPFVDVAKAASCSNVKNNLSVIDNKYVFWDRAGQCADNSYGYTLYGATPDKILCEQYDSIAGPRTTCRDESARSLFDTIVKNTGTTDLGLGSSHQVQPVTFSSSANPVIIGGMPERNVAQGWVSNIKTARNVVIYDAAALRALWLEHRGNADELPTVDFEKFMVLGVFTGEREGACHAVNIDGATKGNKGSIDVVYSEHDMSATCRVTADAAKPSPFHLFKVETQRLPVDFHRVNLNDQPMTEIDAPNGLHFTEPAEVVVKDAAAWTALWNSHLKPGTPATAAPAVDFSKFMVIGVALGQKAVPCHELRIEAVERTAANLTVHYTHRDFTPVCLVAVGTPPAFPKYFVTVPRSDLPVVFKKTEQGVVGVPATAITPVGQGIEHPQSLVIKDAASWARLWAQTQRNTTPAAPLPAIDFSKQMVIAAFAGMQTDGCHSIAISSIDRNRAGLRVEVRHFVPGPASACLMAITYPGAIVVTDRYDGPVYFEGITQTL
ncbi:MAG TPA: protease complex subunit PrcB family protein [Burkholderiaceae bacterium]